MVDQLRPGQQGVKRTQGRWLAGCGQEAFLTSLRLSIDTARKGLIIWLSSPIQTKLSSLLPLHSLMPTHRHTLPLHLRGRASTSSVCIQSFLFISVIHSQCLSSQQALAHHQASSGSQGISSRTPPCLPGQTGAFLLCCWHTVLSALHRHLPPSKTPLLICSCLSTRL